MKYKPGMLLDAMGINHGDRVKVICKINMKGGRRVKNILQWAEAIATAQMCFDESEKSLRKLLAATRINKQGIAGNYQRMFIRRTIAEIKKLSGKSGEMIKRYKSDEALNRHFSGEQKPTQEERKHYEKENDSTQR